MAQAIPLIMVGLSVAAVATQATLGGIQASQGERGLKQAANQNQAILARSQLTSQRASLVGSSANKVGSGNYGDLNPASTGKTSLLGG